MGYQRVATLLQYVVDTVIKSTQLRNINYQWFNAINALP